MFPCLASERVVGLCALLVYFSSCGDPAGPVEVRFRPELEAEAARLTVVGHASYEGHEVSGSLQRTSSGSLRVTLRGKRPLQGGGGVAWISFTIADGNPGAPEEVLDVECGWHFDLGPFPVSRHVQSVGGRVQLSSPSWETGTEMVVELDLRGVQELEYPVEWQGSPERQRFRCTGTLAGTVQ